MEIAYIRDVGMLQIAKEVRPWQILQLGVELDTSNILPLLAFPNESFRYSFHFDLAFAA